MEDYMKLGKRMRSLSSFIDYGCPSSSYSGNERKKLKTRDNVKYSEDDEVIIVKEIIRNDSFEQLYGSYYCKYCEIAMNSKKTYNDHICGKKHQKNVQSRMPDEVGESLQKDQTRYVSLPTMPRRNSENVAVIQRAAEHLKVPCPALDSITEIQSSKEIYYSCRLCDATCCLHEVLAHLSGFEHKLKCVKEYDLATYRKIRCMDKWEAEEKLRKTLKRLVKHYGFGEIVVEKTVSDSRDSWNYHIRREKTKNYSRHSSYYSDNDYRFYGKFIDQRNPPERNRVISTKRSSKYEESDYRSKYEESNYSLSRDKFLSQPDVSNFDFYCQTCDAHMNNKSMWEKHIIGARHLKNYKKELGELPSKLKSVVIPNARARIMSTLDEITEPVVGLDAIQETFDTNLSLYKYNCFLCGLFSTSLDIIDHILSLKHRNKYLEKIKYPAKETLQEMNLSESGREAIIADMCADVEAKRGRGDIQVRTTDFKWNRKQFKSEYAKF